MFRQKEKTEDVKLIKLCNAGTIYELSMLRGLLEDNKIPYLTKESGAGQYMRITLGISTTGTDILVPEPLLEKANQILEDINWNSSDEIEKLDSI